ncbi:MAG: glycerol-3-phosphate dehydrogenase/oxidase [Ichthyobacteriaceae bacterium]|nr:glycerol-3-phosphate dehydrogenase/oxidase [Ichthyobacteriaceae bacterium]
MDRESFVQQLNGQTIFDIIIIGGGATGLGVALDAASRGYKTALFEQSDFAKGTSSKSTKLVHGGVRYLGQGDVSMVFEALRERGRLRDNAPHLVSDLEFIIPNYSFFNTLLYSVGLKFYDLLAGRKSFGKSKLLSKDETVRLLPNVKENGLVSGVLYHDGQFDDSRFAVNLAQSATEHGAVMLNYFKVIKFNKENGKIVGVAIEDKETGMTYSVRSKVVINAAGVWVDDVSALDNVNLASIVKPSQGVHLVVDKTFLDSQKAMMIPKTSDGRVLFTIPWKDKVIIGTTDTPIESASLEPEALDSEVDFIIENYNNYSLKKLTKKDVLSVFAGLRPLAAPIDDGGKTKEISRRHKIFKSISGLITVVGGKWTTYRSMAEEIVTESVKDSLIPSASSITKNLRLHGYLKDENSIDPLKFYGSDLQIIEGLERFNEKLTTKLHSKYPYKYSHVVWACRAEYCRGVDDFLSRRIRMTVLDAKVAYKMAPIVAEIIASELNKNDRWVDEQIQEYTEIVKKYIMNEEEFKETKQSIN